MPVSRKSKKMKKSSKFSKSSKYNKKNVLQKKRKTMKIMNGSGSCSSGNKMLPIQNGGERINNPKDLERYKKRVEKQLKSQGYDIDTFRFKIYQIDKNKGPNYVLPENDTVIDDAVFITISLLQEHHFNFNKYYYQIMYPTDYELQNYRGPRFYTRNEHARAEQILAGQIGQPPYELEELEPYAGADTMTFQYPFTPRVPTPTPPPEEEMYYN